MKTLWIAIALTAMLGLLMPVCNRACGQGTAFTYQGQLQNNGAPTSGTYAMTFALYNASSGGLVIAGPLTNTAVNVTSGLFVVAIDFGAGAFAGGTNWLQIGVATNGSGNLIQLSPRQQLTPVPYAIESATAATATTATSVPASGIGSGTANINITGSALSAAYAGTAVLANTATIATTATNLIGNVSDVQLSANIPRLNGINNFTGVNFATNAGNSIAGSFTGNGAGLTNLSATAVQWPAINAMPGGGSFSATNPVTTCFTNANFTFGLPTDVVPGDYNQPVIAVTNSSGSPIIITPNPSWHVLPNSIWNCTNWSMVTVFVYPGVITNAACTPIF